MNRAQGPPRKISKIYDFFFSIFPAHAKNWPRGPQTGPGGFFPTNPDLADILGITDFDFENFYFLHFFGSQISGLGLYVLALLKMHVGEVLEFCKPRDLCT